MLWSLSLKGLLPLLSLALLWVIWLYQPLSSTSQFCINFCFYSDHTSLLSFSPFICTCLLERMPFGLEMVKRFFSHLSTPLLNPKYTGSEVLTFLHVTLGWLRLTHPLGLPTTSGELLYFIAVLLEWNNLRRKVDLITFWNGKIWLQKKKKPVSIFKLRSVLTSPGMT